jgi:hypothetical protein
MTWTEERVALLQSLWADGIAAGQIAKRLGITRGMVAGKRHSLGLPPRELRAQREAMAANARRTASIRGHDGKLTREEDAAKRCKRAEKIELLIKPLSGSTPRPWVQRAFGECAFPVAGHGVETLSCCLPVEHGRPYCLGHGEILAGRPWPPLDLSEMGWSVRAILAKAEMAYA